jgi:hypothetical protein
MRHFVSNGSAWVGASAVSMSILWEIFWGPGAGVLPGDLLGPLAFAAFLLVTTEAIPSLAHRLQLLPERRR